MRSEICVVGSVPDKVHKMRYGGVTVLTQNLLDYMDESHISYSFVQNNKYSNLRTGEKRPVLNMVYALWQFLRKMPRSKVVMFNFSDRGVAGIYPILARMAKFLGKKIALRKFGGSFEEYYLTLSPSQQSRAITALRLADCIFFETKSGIEHLRGLLDTASPIYWFPNCRKKSSYLKDKHDFHHRCVVMSEINSAKGIDDLLEVKKRLPSNYSLDIYGYISEEKYKHYDWESYGVSFHGEVPSDQVLKTLVQYDLLLLLTSYREGYPGIIIEALSCGMPCIATRVGGIPEIIHDGYNGLLVEKGNLNQIESAVKEITADNYVTYSDNALRSFEDNFDSDSTNKKVVEILLSLSKQ